MANYDLNDNVNDDFSFKLRDNSYKMRYPRTDEVEKIQALTQQIEAASRDKEEAKVESLNKELENLLYGFITPDGHQLQFRDEIRKENVKVMRNFNKMINTELSVQ